MLDAKAQINSMNLNIKKSLRQWLRRRMYAQPDGTVLLNGTIIQSN